MIGAPDLYWYVPTNSPIHKVEDFNGKTGRILLDRLVEPCRAARMQQQQLDAEGKPDRAGY